MQDLIQIETTPPSIVANFDEIETRLREYLQQYDVVVSPDHVGDAKKLRTELRKQISELDTRIKDALRDVSEPIREADERRKQLIQLGRDVDNKIKEQIERCETETKREVEQLLYDLRRTQWREHDVADEFKRAEFDDLIKLTVLTKKGKLTKSTVDTLISRVRDDKALQDRTERRLAELTSRSYEAGLAAPLVRHHVSGFLFGTDEVYERELQRILDAEVDRQAKAEQRAREQAERDQKAKREAEQREAERQERLAEAAQAEQTAPQDDGPDETRQRMHETHERVLAETTEQLDREVNGAPAAPEKPAPDGRVTYFVTAVFEIRVAPETTIEQIRDGAKKVLEKAGIKTLKNVSAQRKLQGAA